MVNRALKKERRDLAASLRGKQSRPRLANDDGDGTVSQIDELASRGLDETAAPNLGTANSTRDRGVLYQQWGASSLKQLFELL